MRVCVVVCDYMYMYVCMCVCSDDPGPLQISFLPQFTPLSPSHLSIVIVSSQFIILSLQNPKVSVLDWHVSSSCQPAGQALLVLV